MFYNKSSSQPTSSFILVHNAFPVGVFHSQCNPWPSWQAQYETSSSCFCWFLWKPLHGCSLCRT